MSHVGSSAPKIRLTVTDDRDMTKSAHGLFLVCSDRNRLKAVECPSIHLFNPSHQNLVSAGTTTITTTQAGSSTYRGRCKIRRRQPYSLFCNVKYPSCCTGGNLGPAEYQHECRHCEWRCRWDGRTIVVVARTFSYVVLPSKVAGRWRWDNDGWGPSEHIVIVIIAPPSP
jgi:hypothetical protein